MPKRWSISLSALVLCTLLALQVQEPISAQSKNALPWFRKAKAADQASAEERARVFESASKKLLDSVAAEERKAAINEIIRVAGRKKATPLVGLLAQRAPDKVYAQLLGMIAAENAGPELLRKEFVEALILALPQVSPARRKVIEGVLLRPELAKESAKETGKLLVSKNLADLRAAVAAARLRPHGTVGVVSLIDGLVALLAHKDESLRLRAERALAEITALEIKGRRAWRIWSLEVRSSEERATAIADAMAARAKALEAKNHELSNSLLKEVLTRIESQDKEDQNALIEHLASEHAKVRAAAIQHLSKLLPKAEKAAAEQILRALMRQLDPAKEESEKNLLAIAEASRATKSEALPTLISEIESALLRNGLSSTVTIALIKSLKGAQALPLFAKLFAKREAAKVPYGDAVQIALFSQLEAVALGELSGVQAEDFAKILGVVGARLSADVQKSAYQAYLKEVRKTYATLSLLSSFGRDVSPMAVAFVKVATQGEDLPNQWLGLLRQARKKSPAKTRKLISESKVAHKAFDTLWLSQGAWVHDDKEIDLAKIKTGALLLEDISALGGETWASDWLKISLDHLIVGLIERKSKEPAVMSLIDQTIAFRLRPWDRDWAYAGNAMTFVVKDFDARAPYFVRGCEGIEDAGLRAKAILSFESRTHARSLKSALAWLSLTENLIEGKEAKAQFAKLKQKRIDAYYAATLKANESKQATLDELLKLAAPGNAKKLAKVVLADLKAKADASKERDRRASLLLGIAAKIAGVDVKDVTLKGDKAAFLIALGELEKKLK